MWKLFSVISFRTLPVAALSALWALSPLTLACVFVFGLSELRHGVQALRRAEGLPYVVTLLRELKGAGGDTKMEAQVHNLTVHLCKEP
jgi:hypothetical protein